MDIWKGKTAVITGAGGGICSVIAIELNKHGLVVVGIDANEDSLKSLSSRTDGKIHGLKCDVTNDEDVKRVFEEIETKFGGVDLLINGVGYLNFSAISEGSSAEWKRSLDINVLSMAMVSKEALKTLKTRDHGLIININSITGHEVDRNVFKGSIGMYPVTKHAVTALTKTLRVELRNSGLTTRITSLSPGLVDTGLGRLGASHVNLLLENPTGGIPLGLLSPQDIADAVISVISMNPRVEIEELTLNHRMYGLKM